MVGSSSMYWESRSSSALRWAGVLGVAAGGGSRGAGVEAALEVFGAEGGAGGRQSWWRKSSSGSRVPLE